MSAELVSFADGVVTIRFEGKLQRSELTAMQRSTAEIIDRNGKIRLLCLAESFNGWDKSQDWGDVSFQSEYDPMIEKIAIVGAPKWEDLTLLFTAKGIRRVPIEFFAPSELGKARAWLNEAPQPVTK